MGICQCRNKQPKHNNSACNKTSSSKNLYKFYWKSNENPFDLSKDPIWEIYDPNKQIHLNQNYVIFLKDNNKRFVKLLSPYQNYLVEYHEKFQIHSKHINKKNKFL